MKTRPAKILSVLCGICLALTSSVLPAQREELKIERLTEKDLPAASEMENVIRQALRKPVNLNLKEATLQEIARAISEEFMISADIDRVSLADVGIDLDATYDLSVRNISLGTALSTFLAAHDLTYAISKEQLLFTSSDSWLTSVMIHDVSDLLAAGEPQRVAVVRRGVTSSSFDFKQLIDLIEMQSAPDDWEDVGGPGSIQAVELNGKQLLLVSQTEPAQQEVEKFLLKLLKAVSLRSTATIKCFVVAP